MRRIGIVLLAFTTSLGILFVPTVLAGICFQHVPLGGIEPQRPIWCETLSPGTDTHVEGANSWFDNFDHGNTFASLNPAYVEGEVGNIEGLHFQHNNHWMVDLQHPDQNSQYATLGALWMRPNRSFTANSGKLVVEFEVATPIEGTRDVASLSDSWPEIVLSNAAAPTPYNQFSDLRPNGTYLYEAFAYAWSFGCRIQQSRHPICALYRPNQPGIPAYAGGPDRLWEINQNGGDVRFEFGGDPVVAGLADDWAVCDDTVDPDTTCRNFFRLEVTANELWLYVRKPGVSEYTLYYHAGLIDSNLGNIIGGPTYVYLGDFAYQIGAGPTLRFHWDHLAINPGSTPTPVPSATPTNTLLPVPTVTSTPTSTVIATATATATPCDGPGNSQNCKERKR